LYTPQLAFFGSQEGRMGKKVDTTLSIKDQLKQYVSSLRRKPGRNMKLNIQAEVRFVKGQWTVVEDIQWTERKHIDSEMLGSDLTESDWQKIFSLPELSPRERRENEVNQEVFLWLKKYQRKPDEQSYVSNQVQSSFNKWCKRLPYRIVNFRRFPRRVDRTYIGKLY
jgi:hypothetical protein